ncbi:Hypothetical predicted protein [Mytilus galloprovincialis]|uniref:CCHC-type domain-containing protein n=1 Tax=Mytilus galloprovincialis TaxID=29158 RepID=A0A8B6DUG3_MYTGA|nr:Hypothetical predicted protein [Mytilus galloprovincialis]
MSEPAEINMLIDRKIKDAMSQNQNEILQSIDRLMSSRLDTFQRSVHETQRQLSETQMSKIQQMNTENYVFKRKGNEEQFKVNTKIANKMKEARSILTESQDNNESTEGAMRNICEGLDILNHRQKLIKLADQSENGWRTVTEYETHNLADDSEDEKRIIRAENKASRKMKSDKKFKTRTTPYSAPQSTRFSSVNQQSTVNIPVVHRPGKCYECGLSGHWRSDHYKQGWQTQKEKSDKISTRLFSNDLSVNFGRENAIVSCNSPVGKLRSSIDYWRNIICANETVIDIIEHGYKIPFHTEPSEVFLNNNKSSLENSDFVENEILKLIELGCIKEFSCKPKVVNPLTVANNKNKLRLVLDCRHINPHLHKFRFKYEDASVASQMFKKGDYCFTYDLRSALPSCRDI